MFQRLILSELPVGNTLTSLLSVPSELQAVRRIVTVTTATFVLPNAVNSAAAENQPDHKTGSRRHNVRVHRARTKAQH